jgi:putative ABC transport system permease protein
VKFLPLIWAGIWRKKGRAVLALLSILNAFLMFGLLHGFTSGIDQAMSETRADVLVSYSRVSQIEGLPIAHGGRIAQTPGVTAVSPVLVFFGTYQRPTQFVRAFAVDPSAFAAVNPQMGITADHAAAMQRTRSGVVVGKQLAEQYGWKVGQRVPVSSPMYANRDGTRTWPLDIVGIYAPAKGWENYGQAALMNYAYLDEGRVGQNGTAMFFFLRVADPERAGEIGAAVDAQFANSPHETKTVTERQMAQDQMKQIGDIGLVINAILGAMFFALLFSIGAVMMQGVRERTGELAVLKTLGFRDVGVLGLVLAETLIFCLVSAAIGLAIALTIFPLVKRWVAMEVPPGPLMATGLAIAAALALITGLPPAVRAMRLKIVDALAGR